tara:strand:- start:192 stop:368 length:177 start_codon:yes stop_codon:yes gene_type:complete
MNNLKIGTLNGIIMALAVVIPGMIFASSLNGSVLGSTITFLFGAVFGICVLIFFKGEE